MHLMVSLTRNVASSENIIKWHVQFDILFYLFYYFSSVIALNGLIEFEVLSSECRWDKLLSQKNNWSSCKPVTGISVGLTAVSIVTICPFLCCTYPTHVWQFLFPPNLSFPTSSQWNTGPSNQWLLCLARCGATAWRCSCVTTELIERCKEESSLAPPVCS